VHFFVGFPRGGRDTETMKTHAFSSRTAAVAQPLTEELIARGGIAPGMRVVVLGAGTGELAFLLAERVGPSGSVVIVEKEPDAVARVQRLAREQRFEHVGFVERDLADVEPLEQADAAFGRFFLMRRRDPVAAIRFAALLVRPGGRLIFQEWHLESTLWEHTSMWPQRPDYAHWARTAIDELRRRGVHTDMGLRLVNAVAAASLPLPIVRTDLRATSDTCRGYDVFSETLSELSAPGGRPARAQVGGQSVGHAFMPLQVGVLTRKPAR
jgi:SAM-dependent methyltransferase